MTFLVTDVLSEVYGARQATVWSRPGCGPASAGLVAVSDAVPSAPFGVGSEMFSRVFGLSSVAVLASMTATCGAVHRHPVFHFWRAHRRSSSMAAQQRQHLRTYFDTFVVLALLATFAESGITWDRVPALFFNGILFKWAFALVDTSLFYLATHLCRRRFGAQIDAVHALARRGLRPRDGDSISPWRHPDSIARLAPALVATALAFSGARDNGFVNRDDYIYLHKNPLVTALVGHARRATDHARPRLPGAAPRLDLRCVLVGAEAAGPFHALSLAVHLLNVGLLGHLLAEAAESRGRRDVRLRVPPDRGGACRLDHGTQGSACRRRHAPRHPWCPTRWTAAPGAPIAFASKPTSALLAMPLWASIWVD